MKRGVWLIVIVVVVLLMPFCLGATLHGKVFDYNFRLAKNSIVKINTVPGQTLVAVDGNYSLTVPRGNYIISAELKDSSGITVYFVNDTVSVVSDGDYVHDLIMFPTTDLGELDLENNVTIDVGTEAKAQVQKTILIFVGLLIIILFVWLFCVAFKKCKKFSLGKKPGLAIEDKDDLTELKDFIRRHKRVTQKDIRKEFPMSEAKISLMLSDLESQDKVRKIKKGRGNIVVWNDK